MWIFIISLTFCTPTLSILDSFSLHQVVEGHTHISPSGNASLIDLALVSNLLQLHKCSIVPPLANSDHSGLDLSIKWRNVRRPATSSKRVVWKYVQADFGKACSLIEGTNWDALISNDVNVSLKNWQNKFLSIIEECIPKQTLPRRRNLPWMSRSLVRTMRKRSRLYKKARKHRNPSLFNCYKRKKNV